MKSPLVTSGQYEKPAAGWFAGADSNRMPWLLADSEFVSGENIIVRGGIPQTRPGYRVSLTLPSGNVQGGIIFNADKQDIFPGIKQPIILYAIAGQVYAHLYPWATPKDGNYEPFRLTTMSFLANAKQIVFCVARKTFTQSGSTLQVVPSYNTVLIQDNVSDCGYYDGGTSGTLSENSPTYGPPRGLWMAFAGERLWIARGSSVIASDLGDPYSYRERISNTDTGGDTRGDFAFYEDVTGLTPTQGQTNQGDLIVFTRTTTSVLQSGILDRTKWSTTLAFKQIIYPALGCIAGKSIVNHLGLLWWMSPNGLVSSDSAARFYLTSQIYYQDIKMARVKAGLNEDLSQCCSANFENYLLTSVPYRSADGSNTNTMCLDAGGIDDSTQANIKAWQGVWTGIKPADWSTCYIDTTYRIFAFCTDWAIANNSLNHVWEAFTENKFDEYETRNADGNIVLQRQRPYCSFETKLYGDLMDLKNFRYAELDLVEIGRTVDLAVSYAGQRGAYKRIASIQLNAVIDDNDFDKSKYPDLYMLYTRVGPFSKQYRRIVTTEAKRGMTNNNVENTWPDCQDKSFSLLVQWCGEMGIEALRIIADPVGETSNGRPSITESQLNVLLTDGRGFKFPLAS